MKLAVLLSGGVDSAVALALLCQHDHEITPVYCKIWLEEENFGAECPWEEDIAHAQSVCNQLGLSLQIHPMQSIYYQRIVAYVIDQLKQGRTPNPDMLCNQYIKFGAFVDAWGDSFDLVASGHYARIDARDDKFYLRTAPDPVKDQSYFLARLSQEQLKRACFPIGAMTKQEVRANAQSLGLANAARKDSQGICFLGKIRYPDFVRYYLGTKKGTIRELNSGKTLGEHQGFWFYTIGQRHGLELAGGPWYVCAKDVAENTVYVQHASMTRRLEAPMLALSELHWIPSELESGVALVKVRHGTQFHHVAYLLSEDRQTLFLAFFAAEKGLAPGQFAVIYIDGYARASGCIAYTLETSEPAYEQLRMLRGPTIPNRRS